MPADDLEPAGPEVEVVAGRRTIVTALPLKPPARHRLAELLDARVADVRESIDDPDLVLTPPCSPQLIGALRRRFGDADIVVVELDDWEFDIEIGGPVKRIIRSGAAAYVLADSLDELAAKIAPGSPTRSPGSEERTTHELDVPATVDDVLATFLRETVEYSVRTNPPLDAP